MLGHLPGGSGCVVRHIEEVAKIGYEHRTKTVSRGRPPSRLRSFRHSLRRIPVRNQAEDLPVVPRGCIRAGSRWSTIGMGKAKSFYRHGGFVESPVDPITMMMLTGDM
jgi:hypothetical protein